MKKREREGTDLVLTHHAKQIPSNVFLSRTRMVDLPPFYARQASRSAAKPKPFTKLRQHCEPSSKLVVATIARSLLLLSVNSRRHQSGAGLLTLQSFTTYFFLSLSRSCKSKSKGKSEHENWEENVVGQQHQRQQQQQSRTTMRTKARSQCSCHLWHPKQFRSFQ